MSDDLADDARHALINAQETIIDMVLQLERADVVGRVHQLVHKEARNCRRMLARLAEEIDRPLGAIPRAAFLDELAERMGEATILLELIGRAGLARRGDAA